MPREAIAAGAVHEVLPLEAIAARLLERLKGNSFENVERTVDVHIRNLRAKIEPQAGTPQYILTAFGVGYRFNPQNE